MTAMSGPILSLQLYSWQCFKSLYITVVAFVGLILSDRDSVHAHPYNLPSTHANHVIAITGPEW